MPRLTDDPWRAATRGDTDIPAQIAEDMTLRILTPGENRWTEDGFTRFVTRSYGPPIVPAKTCR
jgi:hypothetical protein